MAGHFRLMDLTASFQAPRGIRFGRGAFADAPGREISTTIAETPHVGTVRAVDVTNGSIVQFTIDVPAESLEHGWSPARLARAWFEALIEAGRPGTITRHGRPYI